MAGHRLRNQRLDRALAAGALLLGLTLSACSAASPSATSSVAQSATASAAASVSPTPAASSSPQIAVSGEHACALPGDGTVKCWGLNYFGELGDGTRTASSVPAGDTLPLVTVTVIAAAGSSTPLTGVTAIAAGLRHTCAVLTDTTVKCWGWNVAGQLGNGARINSLDPVDVSGLTSGVTAITASKNYACALTGAGAVKCWGVSPSLETGRSGSASDTTLNQNRGPGGSHDAFRRDKAPQVEVSDVIRRAILTP